MFSKKMDEALKIILALVVLYLFSVSETHVVLFAKGLVVVVIITISCVLLSTYFYKKQFDAALKYLERYKAYDHKIKVLCQTHQQFVNEKKEPDCLHVFLIESNILIIRDSRSTNKTILGRFTVVVKGVYAIVYDTKANTADLYGM